MFTGMNTGFDPRRHPRGLDGRFAPAAPPEDPDVGLAADLADPRPASGLATVVLPADPEERAELASRWPPAAAEVLAALVDDTDHGWGIAVAAARNPATPRDALARVAGRDGDEAFQPAVRAAAGNRFTPPDALDTLAGSADYQTRAAVASNPNTRPAALERLAGDPELTVRRRVAQNARATGDTLARLSGDDDAETRLWVACHSRSRQADLERLAGDPVGDIRLAVAENQVTSPATLDRLAGDVRRDIRRAVASHDTTEAAPPRRPHGRPARRRA